MKVDIVTVTPDVALEWLTANTHNRHLSKIAVAKIVEDIGAGRWKDNGETVKFSKTGVLLDGQHRLTAIYMAGVTVRLMVVTGLEDDVQPTIDIGMARTAGSLLSMNGIAQGNAVAALAKMVIRYDECPGVVWGSHNDPTKTEIVEYALEHQEDLSFAVILTQGVRRAVKINALSYAGMTYLVHRDSRHLRRWDTWSDGVRKGEDLSKGDPRLAYRNYHLKRLHQAWGGWETQSMLGMALKAWNAYVLNKDLAFMRFAQSELPMPKVR